MTAEAPVEAPPPGPGRRSLVETWTEVVADASGLVQAEAALARAETSANLKALGLNSALLAGGVALMGLALVFLTVAAVVALAEAIGLLWALLAVGVACVAVGFVLIGSGRSRLAGQKLLPDRAIGRISSDLQALSARGRPMAHDGAAFSERTLGEQGRQHEAA